MHAALRDRLTAELSSAVAAAVDTATTARLDTSDTQLDAELSSLLDGNDGEAAHTDKVATIAEAPPPTSTADGLDTAAATAVRSARPRRARA